MRSGREKPPPSCPRARFRRTDSTLLAGLDYQDGRERAISDRRPEKSRLPCWPATRRHGHFQPMDLFATVGPPVQRSIHEFVMLGAGRFSRGYAEWRVLLFGGTRNIPAMLTAEARPGHFPVPVEYVLNPIPACELPRQLWNFTRLGGDTNQFADSRPSFRGRPLKGLARRRADRIGGQRRELETAAEK